MSVDDISIDAGNDHEALVDRAFIDAFETLAEYERRSLAHVAGLPEQLQAAGLWRGIGFRIGQRRLVSSYESVAEILTVPQITAVPGSHPWMLGVANVRSNLLPVVDLKQFLEGARSVLHEGHQKVMVLRQPGGDVAVTIDELYGQRSFMDEQQVEPEGLIDGRYASFIDRAYRVADDVWGVFSLDRLVRTPEFRHAAV
jgi:twitching motility protein PilI